MTERVKSYVRPLALGGFLFAWWLVSPHFPVEFKQFLLWIRGGR